jgi:hypothetical protein
LNTNGENKNNPIKKPLREYIFLHLLRAKITKAMIETSIFPTMGNGEDPVVDFSNELQAMVEERRT